MFKNKIFIVFAVVLLVTVSSFAQSTTGELHGVVVTEEDVRIAGATITAASPNLLDKKVTISGANGAFKFGSLPPGTYKLTVESEGFKTAVQTGILVSLSKTSTISVKMELGTVTEQVVVKGQYANVDIQQSSVSTNVDKDFFDALPKTRGYQSFILMAPSVQEDPFGQSFGGATGVENMFVIDGVNVTDVERGGGDDDDPTRTTNIVYEYIEEVEVKTGGYEAEYAGALGGVVNIITKSGGNEFHGSLIANFAHEALVGNRKVTYWGRGAIDTDTQIDFGLGVGGYLIKDKLWFFVAATPTFRTREWTVTNAYSGLDQSSTQKDKTYNFSGKLTFLLTKNHTLNASFFGDPQLIEGGRITTLMDPSRDFEEKTNGGTFNFSLKYEGVFGSDWYVSLLVGRYVNKVTTLPLSGDTGSPAWYVEQGSTPLPYPTGYSLGGFGYMSDPNTSARWTVKADITKFWGSHTLKVGFNMYKATLDSNDMYTGGYYYRIRNANYRQRHRTTEGDCYTNVMALYVQDSINIGRLHLNLGLRAEAQSCHGTKPNLNFEDHFNFFKWGLKDMLAPRVGFSYDVFGDFTTKIFGSYARYFEMIPLDINSRQFGNEVDIMYYWRYPFDPNVTIGSHFTSYQYGLHPSILQPDIKPPFQEEYIIGFERQLGKDLSISVRGIYKRLGRIVEDGSFDGGSLYFLFNPGEWIPEDVNIPADYSRCPEEYRTFPKAKRTYKAVEVVVKKRYSNNYQFMISYTYGRAYGNIGGLAFEEYQQQIDPNITAAFDFPDLLYNAEGYAMTDPKHSLKIDGSYTTNFGLNIGLSARFRSGRPYTAMGYNDYYGWMAFLDQRGTTGRLDSMLTADIHLAYTFNLGGTKKLTLFTDIFNITNNTKMTKIYTRYDNINAYGFSDDPSTIMPEWTKPSSPSHPDYGRATRYNLPIRATLGARLEF